MNDTIEVMGFAVSTTKPGIFDGLGTLTFKVLPHVGDWICLKKESPNEVSVVLQVVICTPINSANPSIDIYVKNLGSSQAAIQKLAQSA